MWIHADTLYAVATAKIVMISSTTEYLILLFIRPGIKGRTIKKVMGGGGRWVGEGKKNRARENGSENKSKIIHFHVKNRTQQKQEVFTCICDWHTVEIDLQV